MRVLVKGSSCIGLESWDRKTRRGILESFIFGFFGAAIKGLWRTWKVMSWFSACRVDGSATRGFGIGSGGVVDL